MKKIVPILISVLLVLMFVFVLDKKIFYDIRYSYRRLGFSFWEFLNLRSFLGNASFYLLFSFLSSLRFSTKVALPLVVLTILLIPLQLILSVGSPTFYVLLVAIAFSCLGIFIGRKYRPAYLRYISDKQS